VVGPDDRPVSDYFAAGLTAAARGSVSWMTQQGSPTVTVRGLDGHRPRTVVLYNAEKKLGKAVLIRGDEAAVLRARLEPLSSLSGRVLDATGRPLSGLPVRALFSHTGEPGERLPVQFFMTHGTWAAKLEGETRTDAKGRFHLDGLLPGLRYNLVVSKGESDDPGRAVFRRAGLTPAEAGQNQDLGDLRSGKE
jgi:hypothetical protein